MLTKRAKDPIELYKKQRRKQYADFWQECPDVLGIRIVVSVASEKIAVLRALEERNDIDVFQIEDQTDGADPNRLDYRGLHLHIRAPDLAGIDGSPIRCEVQVRTLAEHAWAETEHKYLYKKSDGIPDDVQRIFRRLLVLVELFDEELEKGVTMVSSHPAFAEHNLIRDLEQQFVEFARTPGDAVLTHQVLGELAESGYDDFSSLSAQVNDYISKHRSDVISLMENHGPDAKSFDVDDHWLVSQPEVLLILALLESNEYGLANALSGSDIARQVEKVAMWTDHPGFLDS